MKSTEIIWACDFETYVPKQDEHFTYVWSAAFVPLFEDGDNVRIVGSIDEFMSVFLNDDTPDTHHTMYFHNLKFDGTFIVDYLLKHGYEYCDEKVLPAKTFSLIVSDMGTWYGINIMSETKFISIRDSLKILPFSLRQLAIDFELTHQKTTMNYFDKTSLDDCTESDIEYIKEDCLVLREALEGILSSGLRGMTIGSLCMKDYRKRFNKKFGRQYWEEFFPKLTDTLPNGLTEDTFVRKSYRGGICYAYRTGSYSKGMTYDKVSMYPGVMKSYKLPYGRGTYFTNNIPFYEMYDASFDKEYSLETLDWNMVHSADYFWFVHIKCNFEIKPNHLPTIQIKNNPLYFGNDYLTTSAVDYNGRKYKHYIKDGKVVPTCVDLYLSMYDFELLLKHYNVTDLEIIDGIYYKARNDMFKVYIDYWARIKKSSTGALRQIAKLFLNNLYGKLSTNPKRGSKIPYLDNDMINFELVESEADPMHIACGSAITSCARYELITTAQANEPFVLYMDTDSIHMTKPLKRQTLKTPLAKIGKEIGMWDKESEWDLGYFVRAKTYAEHVTDKSKWILKGCGCPQRSKDLFLESVDGIERIYDKSETEIQWVKNNPHTIADFTYGLSIPGKLIPKIVPGGTVLYNAYFTIHEQKR